MKLTSAALALLVAATPSLAFLPSPSFTKRNQPSHYSTTDWGLRSTTEEKVETIQLNEESDIAPIIESPGTTSKKASSNFGRTSEEATSAVRNYLSQYLGNTGAHAVYTKLMENGVTVVNGYSGGAVLPLLDQFHEDNSRHNSEQPAIRWITNSNEQNAGHVTEGFAKAQPFGGDHLPVGVCLATSGPGVTNLITPLQDAICDGVPMVVMCGQAATSAPPDAFQSAPAVEMTKPCTKWSYQIKSAAEIPFVFDYAFFVARNGRPGPVFIDLPKDLQNQVLTDDLVESFLSQSINEDSNDEFARLTQRTRASGESFYALHLGNSENGLPFEINEDGSKLKVEHVQATKDANLYEQDHTPMNKVYKFSTPENGRSEELGVPQDLVEGGDSIREIAAMLRRAKKPIILAGQGCNDCPGPLAELADKLQIPVTTTLHALGAFDERSELALNMMGMHGHPTPNFMVQEADLIVCVGSRFDDRITGRMSDFIPEARKAAEEGRGGVIHVDIRVTEKSKQVKPTLFVHSTAKNFLQLLNKQLDTQDVTTNTAEWLQRKRSLERDFPIGIPKFPTQDVPVRNESGEDEVVSRTPMSAQQVIQELNLQLVQAGKIDDAIFTTGVGIHQMVAAQLITWTQPRQMLSSGSLGTMGVSTGYAIGAKLAQWGKIVISVDGDGSFNMTFTELKTIAEQKIPVKILILDNESQMMVEYWQRLFHEKRYLAVRNQNPDYIKLASAFGIKSVYCDCEEELPQRMEEFLNSDPDEPILFHVRIERTPCLPLVAPGQRLENMILEDEDFEVDPAAAPS